MSAMAQGKSRTAGDRCQGVDDMATVCGYVVMWPRGLVVMWPIDDVALWPIDYVVM